MNKISAFLNDETGASAAEYALILAIIAIAIVAALGFLSNAIKTAINDAANNITPGS